jgi:hypothetical protein
VAVTAAQCLRGAEAANLPGHGFLDATNARGGASSAGKQCSVQHNQNTSTTEANVSGVGAMQHLCFKTADVNLRTFAAVAGMARAAHQEGVTVAGRSGASDLDHSSARLVRWQWRQTSAGQLWMEDCACATWNTAHMSDVTVGVAEQRTQRSVAAWRTQQLTDRVMADRPLTWEAGIKHSQSTHVAHESGKVHAGLLQDFWMGLIKFRSAHKVDEYT